MAEKRKKELLTKKKAPTKGTFGSSQGRGQIAKAVEEAPKMQLPAVALQKHIIINLYRK